MSASGAGSERLFRTLLRLYPASFRDRFGDDVLELLRDKHRAAASRGLVALTGFWIRIVRDAVISAIAERFAPSQVMSERGPLMEGLLQDIRFAVRMVARRPALSLIIVLTLALGIGANTAIFSLVNTVLLASVPYQEPDRLVMVREHQPARNVAFPMRPGNFFDWKARAASFEDVAWSRDGMFSLTGTGEPESIIGYRFSANMLTVLGVEPLLGRNFSPDDEKPGAPGVVLLSEKLWTRKFGADRGILGRTLTLNGSPHTVIGVMGAGFKHPQSSELWAPLQLSPALASSRTAGVLRLVGRLRPGVTHDAATQELAALYADMARRYPATNEGFTAYVQPFGGSGDAKPLLLILLAGVGFVLLIACANVANLLLADATARRRELAVRSALGATRYRVIRQMLTESVMLSLVGGAVGALVAFWTRDALLVLFPANISNLNLPLVERIDMGAPVVAYALLLSLLTGLLFGLLPAWTLARTDVQGVLKQGDRGGSGSRRTHSILVVAEVALSIVLLAGALLMVQSFMRVRQLDFGFDTERVLSGRVVLPAYKYGDRPRVEAFNRDLVDRLQQIPGVEAAGSVTYLPLSGWSGGLDFSIEGRPEPTAQERPSANVQAATEDYFRAIGIRLLEGRTFSRRDDRSAPPVVVINETLARRYWPGETAVGRRVLIPGPNESVTAHEVVGVVNDVRGGGLEEPIEPEMYFSTWQGGEAIICVVLRTSLDPTSLVGQLRAAVWSVDRDQPVTHVLPMAELASESLAFRRAGMLLAGGFGFLALVLAAIGIYGVLSYAVSRRTRELGVRMALGATRRQVATLVLRDGLWLTAGGIVLGISAALALTQFLASVLYQVTPGDPLTYVAVAAILLVVALIATLVPARRATAVDPLTALRAE